MRLEAELRIGWLPWANELEPCPVSGLRREVHGQRLAEVVDDHLGFGTDRRQLRDARLPGLLPNADVVEAFTVLEDGQP